MSKTENPRLDSIPPLPLFTLNRAGVNFCNAYMRLATLDRQKVEEILLNHAFLPTGTTSYLSYRYRGRKIDRATSSKRFWDISQDMAGVWYVWAREISETRPSRLQCREAILGLVSRLVYQKFLEAQSAGTITRRRRPATRTGGAKGGHLMGAANGDCRLHLQEFQARRTQF